MEADPTFFRHWDDVVFENRNKTYGAYLLRRAYANRLLTGTCITFAVFAFLLSIRSFYADDIIADVVPPFVDEGTYPWPPPFVEPTKPRNPVRVPPGNAMNRTILVTREDILEEDSVIAIADFVADEGTGEGIIGTPEGIGTVQVAELPPVIEPPFRDFAEVMPEYEGGLEAMMKFIQKKIRYPRVPQKLGIDGTVFVRFIVNGDGSISEVEVIKSVHPDYDKEAMRVISMLPSWKGGNHNGRPVSVRMVLPIRFNLKKE